MIYLIIILIVLSLIPFFKVHFKYGLKDGNFYRISFLRCFTEFLRFDSGFVDVKVFWVERHEFDAKYFRMIKIRYYQIYSYRHLSGQYEQHDIEEERFFIE